jgi:hypothetical protein
MNGAMLGQNHARHSSALSNSQKGSKVARVGDSVYSQQERGLAIHRLKEVF